MVLVDYLQELVYDFWKYIQLWSFFKCNFVLRASSSIIFWRRQTKSRWINIPAGEVDSVVLRLFKWVQYQSYTALVCWRAEIQNHEPNHFIGLASSLASLSFLTGSAHHSFDIFPVEFCSLFCFWGGFLQPRMTWQKLLSKSLTQRFVLFCSSLMKTMRFEMVAWPWAEVIFVEHSLQKLSLRVFLFSSWRWCSR